MREHSTKALGIDAVRSPVKYEALNLQQLLQEHRRTQLQRLLGGLVPAALAGSAKTAATRPLDSKKIVNFAKLRSQIAETSCSQDQKK